MGKQRKPKKRPQGKKRDPLAEASVMDVTQKLPPGHRFDEEIGHTAYCALLKSQSERIENGISIERTLREFITKKILARSLSKVSTKYFANMVMLAKERPLDSPMTKMIEVTYDEYVLVSKHMSKISSNFKSRLDNFILEIENMGWNIHKIEAGFNDKLEDGNSHFVYNDNYEDFFDEDGRLVKTLTLVAKTPDKMPEFIEKGYEHGLLFFKENQKGTFHALVVFPENNVPGVPLLPQSIKDKSRV